MDAKRDARPGKPAGEREGGRGDAPAEVPADPPAEKPADKPGDKPKVVKEKVTYSLPSRLKRLVDSVASDLGIPPCELVARLLTPALKGCSRPTIPAELRRLFPQERESAA